MKMTGFMQALHQVIMSQIAANVAALLAAVGIALLVHYLAFWGLGRIVKATGATWDDLCVLHLKRPARFAAIALALQFVRPLLSLPAPLQVPASQALGVFSTVCIAWLSIRGTGLLRDLILLRFKIDIPDNMRSRKVQTQVKVLQRIIIFVIILVASSVVLMMLPGVGHIGVSLLASAGIAGAIVGLAAQKVLGNLLAGVQLVITQPMALDDVVIVEGEWGWVEEITLSYVVVKIWDLRRLVIPISYFLEKPFQNWTRTSSQLLGTVILHCDPTTSVGVLRAELERIVRGTPLWDGKVSGTQVTDSRPDSIEVRFLVSAADSSRAWDLRCLVREAILTFLQRDHPEWLPQRRIRGHLQGFPSVRRGSPASRARLSERH